MSLRRLCAAAAVLAAVAVGAPAASAQEVNFTNWTVSGTLGIRKLSQSITIPAGATFTGSWNVATGSLTGHVSVPTIRTRLRVLGFPVDATLELQEAQPVSGSISIGADGNVTVSARSAATIYIRRLASPYLPLNLVRSATCRTSRPVELPLSARAPFTALAQGLTFSGVTTLPPLTGCGLSTPLLNLLMAGPNNPFAIRLAPPASGGDSLPS